MAFQIDGAQIANARVSLIRDYPDIAGFDRFLALYQFNCKQYY